MRVIAITPAESVISLTWMLGARCNYDCMYCPAELHDTTSRHPDLNKLKQIWTNFYNKTQHTALPYKLSFTGGEVTANKSFLPLLDFLRSQPVQFSQITVTSNGSASLNYYRKLCEKVDALALSTHSEFFNEAEFFNKALELDKIMIRPKKNLHVNIMDEPWNRTRIELYRQWLEKHNISYSVNYVHMDTGTRTYPILKGTYNIEQI